MKRSTKAVIPVAGYGTRRLPVTKVIEKCMLPLGNRPAVDYTVADCIRAGITDIYFVVSGEATQLREYYGHNAELEQYLQDRGKSEELEAIQPPRGVNFHYVQQDLSQDKRYGTTIPIWLCREFIDEDELFLILMGDDVTYNPRGVSDIETLVELGEPAILGVTMPDGDLSRYGVIAQDDNGIFTHIHEKPEPGAEPSRMINVSKYVMPGGLLRYITAAVAENPNEKGEYYITDPINAYIAEGLQMRVVEARGKYLDTGTLAAWVDANNWLLGTDS